MSSPFRSLEAFPGLSALLPFWRKRAGVQFALFRALCLDPMEAAAEMYPCPQAAHCNYRIIRQPGQAIAGQCERDPRVCDVITFTEEDVTPLQFNWHKFALAACKAFNLEYRFLKLPITQTAQIGTWSADAIPVIFTVQHYRSRLRHAAAELVARLNQPFILLTPTSRLADVSSLEHLNRVRAAFFPLEGNLIFTPGGNLQSVTVPGELFKAFTPQPRDIDKSVAERAMALIQQLESQNPSKPPSVLAVFQLYCIENLSVSQVAAKCNCSVGTVANRLKIITSKTGIDPKELRRSSTGLET